MTRYPLSDAALAFELRLMWQNCTPQAQDALKRELANHYGEGERLYWIINALNEQL